MWGSEEEPVEDLEQRVRKKIKKYGCEPEKYNWIHPHEIVPIETPELGYEEYPAMCYYHVKDCTIRNIVRMMKDGIL